MTSASLVTSLRTKIAVDQFVAEPGNSLLLLGAPGAGKLALAQHIIELVLATPLTNHPYYLHLKPTGKTISIESVREAQQFVRLKTAGERALRRAIIVEDAHTLTTEAQNAFLKLLEEPPADTIIVLTATSREALLPTIASRTQIIPVKPVEQEKLTQYFVGQDLDATEVTRAYYMSGGQPGLMNKMLTNADDNELLGYIDTAKKLLQAQTFERLVYADEIIKQKQHIPSVLWALQTVAQSALRQAVEKSQTNSVKKWHQILQAILQAQDGLSANPLPKLLLTNLILQF